MLRVTDNLANQRNHCLYLSDVAQTKKLDIAQEEVKPLGTLTMSSNNASLNIWFAGAFAGFSINLLFFPLDTLKTRLQSPQYQQIYRSPSAVADRALYRGLYQGISTVSFITLVSSGVFFTTYESSKRALGSSWIPEPAVHAASSSVAQLVTCAVITPAEVLKQNTQMLMPNVGEKRRGSPTVAVMWMLVKHPAGLWSGYTALVARDLPFAALQFPAFEYLKKLLSARRAEKKGGNHVAGVLEHAKIAALSAGIAGSAAAWVTTPFDVVKTRMMLEAGARRRDKHPATDTVSGHGRDTTHRSGIRICKEVCRNEGLRGLFRGGLIRVAWTIVGNGLFMGCYEGARFYLDD